jgi:hypothetical protein
MSMKRNGASLALAIVLFGCAPTPTPDTAIMPLTGAGTPQMSDTGAIGLASYVLGSPSRYDGHPADAARALAAVDYLAGALYANPHWVGIPAESKLRMLQARTEVRRVLDVPPGTPSQKVVDGLMAAANALAGDDTAAARAALPSSVFGLGPDRTIALLNNLPPLPAADAAAQYLNYDTMTNCSFTANCG